VQVVTSNIGTRGQQLDDKAPVRRLPSVEIAHTPLMWGLFSQLLRSPKNGIIHVHIAPAYSAELTWLAAKLRRVPYVAHFHLDVSGSGVLGGLFEVYKKTILPVVLRGATRVITLTQAQRQFVIDRYKVQPDRAVVLPNGVGPEYFSAPRPVHSPLRLMFMGRLAQQKRAIRLVEAMAAMQQKNVHLTIVGDGYQRQMLQERARELGVASRITFAGFKRGASAVAEYHNADVFVLPSDREGMPLSVLEAAAAGLAIVGSDVMGIRELIADVGVLVPHPSGKTFATALDVLAKNPAKVQALAKKSYAMAADYSWEKLGDRLQKIYEEVPE
jgi:phosphatidylinositol alpha-mannosyltransferase